MPNWCYNKLTVIGKKEEIERFIAKAASFTWKQWGVGRMKTDAEVVMAELASTEVGAGDLVGPLGPMNFDAFVPIPDEILSKDSSNHGYHWCCENWGTKWNACESSEPMRTPRGVHYGFETAWSPPTMVIMAMSMQFPTLRFTIDSREESEGQLPKEIYKAGEQIK